MADLAFSENVNFEKLCELESGYKTQIDPEFLPRLKEACVRVVAPAEADFRFFVDLQGLRTIEGTVSVRVAFTCQRCQKEFETTLSSSFSSTCDEQKAKSLKLDEKLDIVELEDDGTFNLLNFLEDCLLLEVPYITSHEEGDPECEGSNEEWSFGSLDPEATKSPFAQLEALKDKLKK